ncbi:4Fe-4S dicluster domain-containing protein [Chloroflexota bacterium]
MVTVEPRELSDRIVVDFVPTTCRHCAKPPCADACPTKAIEKRGDGVVIIDEELCISCMECLSACPFGVIQFNDERNVAEKCNMCFERTERGLKPACAHHCPSGAILFGDINEITDQLKRRSAQREIQRVDVTTS